MVHRNYHVIIGTGPVGRAVMHRLIANDQPVRMVNRTGMAAVPARVDVVQADVTDAHSTQAACRGATVVYHCINAPYARWPHTLPSMMEGLIRGAASAGAVLVYADN